MGDIDEMNQLLGEVIEGMDDAEDVSHSCYVGTYWCDVGRKKTTDVQKLLGNIKVEINRADGPKSSCCDVSTVWINAKQHYICPNCGDSLMIPGNDDQEKVTEPCLHPNDKIVFVNEDVAALLFLDEGLYCKDCKKKMDLTEKPQCDCHSVPGDSKNCKIHTERDYKYFLEGLEAGMDKEMDPCLKCGKILTWHEKKVCYCFTCHPHKPPKEPEKPHMLDEFAPVVIRKVPTEEPEKEGK